MFEIAEELKKLPDQPGVYIMHDSRDAIIYIGKAVSLRKRVHQYFQASHDEGIKKAQMVKQIARFEYIITDSELEALVLECNLIKEHRPKYNTMLRDDKTYPYIRVTVGEDFPRVLFSRQQKKDRSRYFGPYTSAGAVKDTIELINKLYQLRTCNRNLPKDIGKDRPCLNYHIHQCNAPCQGYISKEEYNKNFNKALKLIEGDYKQVIEYLEEKMYEASEKMEYEQAAVCRDLIESVKKMSVKQKINDFGGMDRDVVALARTNEEAVVQVFFIREGKLIGRDHFHLKGSYGEKENDMLQAFIKQFYAGTPFIPREVMVEYEVTESELIEKWLSEKRGGKVSIIVPKKGQKERLVELAHKNAAMVLTKDMEKIKREEERTTGAMKQISGWLGLEDVSRVESYDISNISGFLSVGSMVVFDDGKPKKSEYRKFRIKTVEGPNDYASMYEVLKRRFSHGLMEIEQLNEKNLSTEFGSFTKFPDLIMMDGGVGQVHIAMQVLSELDIDIPVCGMVKDDNHRTRGLFFDEHEIPIDTNSEGFRLMTRIQDEVHRFAIEYHRSLRSKEQVKSILDDIPGIGEKRRKALMKHFASIEAIKNAAIDELAQAESMNEKAAASVYKFFHQGGAKE